MSVADSADEALLVVNTAAADREVRLRFAQGDARRVQHVSLAAGGYASVTAPAAEGLHSLAVNTDDGQGAVIDDTPWLPMVVVRERTVELC